MQSWLCDNGFMEHPKHGQLAKRLGIKRDDAMLIVMRLFCWVARVRERGDLSGALEEEIADACRWKKKPGTLVGALVDVGWMDLLEDGGMVIHGWLERHSTFFSKRESNKVAQANHRAKRAAEAVVSAYVSTYVSHDVTAPMNKSMNETYSPTPFPHAADGMPRAVDLPPAARRYARERASERLKAAEDAGNSHEVVRLRRLIGELEAADLSAQPQEV